MVTPKSRYSPLHRSFEKAIRHLSNRTPKRINVSWECDNDVSSQLRKEHVKYCKDKKTYFPIIISHKDDMEKIVCCIDKTDAASMKNYIKEKEASRTENSMIGMLSSLYKKGACETRYCKSNVVGFNAIDNHYKLMLDAKILSKITETMPGITQQRLDVVVSERMQYAFKSLCSYLTLKNPPKAPFISVAFVHASLLLGYGYGIPIMPRQEAMCASLLGIEDDFNAVATEAYDYLIFEAYLERIFPMMGLVYRETLLSDHEKYLNALRSYDLGSKLSQDMLKDMDMDVDEVDKRIKEIGLVYD